jgi:hypothetical protein
MEAAAGAEEMAHAAETLSAAARVATALESRRSAVRRAVEGLVGKEESFLTTKGRRKGEVEEVTGEGFSLTAEIVINGEVRGVTRFGVRWDELAIEDEERLAGLPAGLQAGRVERAAGLVAGGADFGIARAYLALLSGEADAAEGALEAAADHPLGAPLREKIVAVRLGAAEAAARRAWEEIERVTSAGDISRTRAKGLLAKLAAFETDHAGTKLAASLGERIADLRSRTEHAGEAKSLSRGLVAHWKFDEGRGAVARDSSGHGNHGAVHGGAWVSGRLDLALRFDGKTYVVVPDSPSLNPRSAISIAAWVKVDTWKAGNERILQKGMEDDQYRFLDEGPFKFHIAPGKDRTLVTRLPSTGEWHHVAATYDGSAMRICVDGEPAAELAATGLIPVTSGPVYIGCKHPEGSPGDYMRGLMDDIRVYDRALTPAEVRLLAGPHP